MNFSPIHTTHSRERWAKHFSFLDIKREWDSVTKATKRQKVRIKRYCPVASKENKDVDYYISENLVVFVCGDYNVLVKVFPYVQELTKKTKPMCRNNGARYKIQRRIEKCQ